MTRWFGLIGLLALPLGCAASPCAEQPRAPAVVASAEPSAQAGKDRAKEDAKAAEIASELTAFDLESYSSPGSGKDLIDEGPAELLSEEGRGFSGDWGVGSLNPPRDIGSTPKGPPTSAGGAKPEKPLGTAKIGTLIMSGGTVANAKSVAAQMRGRFRNCYNAGLKGDPELAGSATLIAKIGPHGEVMSVGGGASGGFSTIVPCLKSVVRSGGFAPPEGGSALIGIPITFVKQG